MKNLSRVKISCLLFIVTICVSRLGAIAPAATTNYYELIGLNYEDYKKETAAKIQQLNNKNAAYVDKEIREKITQACQKARKEYQKQIEKAQKEVEEAEGFERQKKNEAFLELQKKLNLTKTACPFLLDPKKRRAYDEGLERPQGSDTFFQKMQHGLENAILLAPDKKVIINDIVGDLLSQIEIPGPAVKIFNQNLDVRSLSLLPRPMGPDVQYGIGFTGLMTLNRLEVRLSVYIIQDIYGAKRFSFTVDLPQTYKISDLFPAYKGFDAFEFPQAKFIIANFEGTDNDGFPFKKGFNFGAMLNLSGPLKVLGELRDKAATLKSIVVESRPIIMSGVIPLDISQAEFTAQVPLYIGVDLQKIAALPKTISDVINQITTDEFTLEISPVKPKKETKIVDGEEVTEAVKPYVQILKAEREPTVEIVTLPNGEEDFIHTKVAKATHVASFNFGYKVTVETGLRIVLGTQREPIRLNVQGIVIPVSKDHPQGFFGIGGSMKGMLQLKWLALGNAGLDFDFDGALMPAAAAFGIPFTGMGIRGQLDLGKQGPARATLKLGGGFRVAASTLPDIVFDVSGENIQLGTLIEYGMKKAAEAKILKNPIPAGRIPTMTLHHISGYCAVNDTTIAGKLYRAGLGLQVETQLFDHKAGIRLFMNDKFKFSGWGYMPAIDLKVKGHDVFRLYGITADKGPHLEFNFDPQNPAKGRFGVQGTVHIPALSLRHKTDFTWHGYLLDADFETELPAGFSVLFGIRMNLKEGTEEISPYGEIKQEVETLLETIGIASSDAQAAKKLFDEAVQLEEKNHHEQAINRLKQAKSLLTAVRPTGSQEKIIPAIGTSRDAFTQVKLLEGQMRAIKQDVDALLQRAEGKQGDPRYKAAEEFVRKATVGYQQYYSPDAKERWDALYQFTFNTLLHKARKKLPISDQEKKLIGAGAERAVALEKIKKVEAILQNLTKARTWLLKVVDEKNSAEQDAEKALTMEREVEKDKTAKWRKLYIKFGFKGDFGKFLNEQAAATLRNIKDNAARKLDQLTKRIAELPGQAMGNIHAEIARVKEMITAKEKEITTLQTECRTLPLYKQPKCRASIAAHQTLLASRKAYLHALLTPGKAVVKRTAGAATSVTLAHSRALRSATEAILEGAAGGLEMIGAGINFFNIVEARGEYSWDDMESLKLPKLVRLVANLDLVGSPMQIVLTDLQFDFKNPAASAAEIVRAIATAFIEQQQNKYLRYAERLME